MSKPTLEEVKEYFKDALIILDHCNLIADMNNIDERGIHEWAGSYWVFDNDMANVVVWSKNSGYSKIIEYKIPPYNHNHIEQKKELNYDNLQPLEQLQIDYTFLQSDFTDFVKKVETVYNQGRELQQTDDSGSLCILLNKLENIINFK